MSHLNQVGVGNEVLVICRIAGSIWWGQRIKPIGVLEGSSIPQTCFVARNTRVDPGLGARVLLLKRSLVASCLIESPWVADDHTAAMGRAPAQSPSSKAASIETRSDELVANPLSWARALTVADSELVRGSSGQDTSVDAEVLAPKILGTPSRVISIS